MVFGVAVFGVSWSVRPNFTYSGGHLRYQPDVRPRTAPTLSSVSSYRSPWDLLPPGRAVSPPPTTQHMTIFHESKYITESDIHNHSPKPIQQIHNNYYLVNKSITHTDASTRKRRLTISTEESYISINFSLSGTSRISNVTPVKLSCRAVYIPRSCMQRMDLIASMYIHVSMWLPSCPLQQSP